MLCEVQLYREKISGGNSRQISNKGAAFDNEFGRFHRRQFDMPDPTLMSDQGFKSGLRNGSLRYFGEGSDYSFHGYCAEIILQYLCVFYIIALQRHVFE